MDVHYNFESPTTKMMMNKTIVQVMHGREQRNKQAMSHDDMFNPELLGMS